MRSLSALGVVVLVGCGQPNKPADMGPDLSADGCHDGEQDGDETDVDCGGSCAPCDTGKMCMKAKDCLSTFCTNLKCDPPSCGDQAKNGDETDVDCGGTKCPPCAVGKMCKTGTDCTSGTCTNGTCQTSPCTNGKLDGQETDIDCGGPVCSKCADNKMCKTGTDCMSGTCTNNMCKPDPQCTDNKKDGDETDVDCGGTKCSKCPDGKTCLKPADCMSGKCTAGKCGGGKPLTLGFAMPVSYPGGGGGYFAVADVNEDKTLDLVTLSNNANTVLILPGKGDGTFTTGPSFSVPSSPNFVAVADLNNDKHPDLLVANNGSDGLFYVLLGSGKGAFQAAALVPHAAGEAAVADFNGDGVLDLVTPSLTSIDTYEVLFGKGDGTFPTYQEIKTSPRVGGRLIAADFDGDKNMDFAAGVFNGNSWLLHVFLGTGKGTFQQPGAYSLGMGAPGVVAVKDVNHDGAPDIVVLQNTQTFMTFLNKGDGTFTMKGTTATGINGLAVDDFDLDGKPDVAVGGANPMKNLHVHLGNGDGTFPSPLEFDSGTHEVGPLVAADLNGDGLPDLVANELNHSMFLVFLNTSK